MNFFFFNSCQTLEEDDGHCKLSTVSIVKNKRGNFEHFFKNFEIDLLVYISFVIYAFRIHNEA